MVLLKYYQQAATFCFIVSGRYQQPLGISFREQQKEYVDNQRVDTLCSPETLFVINVVLR